MEGKTFKQRYQLEDKLGSGRLADVYAADDLQLDQEVAVKVLYPQIASDPAYIQKLESELKVAEGLEHPSITGTRDWGREDDLYFVVTDYVEGKSLKDIMSSEGKFPPERAARVVGEVCEALELAHSRGLVHGGLSPQNIFIDEMGEVKVMDIGMAWTATGRGTPQYVSPEQAQGLAVDARTDVYTMGIVLYEMLTGKPPLDGPDPETVARKQVEETPVEASAVDPSVPAALNVMVMKALAKNPAMRYQSAREMKTDLLGLRGGVPAPAVATAAVATAAAKANKPSHTLAWVTVGVLSVVAIVAVLAILLSSGGTKTVTVPNIVGLTEAQARQALDNVGLKMETQNAYAQSEIQKAGEIAAQDPAQGATLDEGSTVTATVIVEMRMPDVVGLGQADAVYTLNRQYITKIEVSSTSVLDPTKIGTVLSQSPVQGILVTPDTSVSLQVGGEAQNVVVPNVVGVDQATAKAQLENVGLVAKVTQQASSVVQVGLVISQSPSAGQPVQEGSTVNIVVSVTPTPG